MHGEVSEMPLCTIDVSPVKVDENIFNGCVRGFCLWRELLSQSSGYETITVAAQCNVVNTVNYR